MDRERIRDLWKQWPRRKEAEKNKSIRMVFHTELKSIHGIDAPYRDVMGCIAEWERTIGETDRLTNQLNSQ